MLECGQIDEAAKHMFDYDNQFIPTEKYDSKYSYKKAFGYFPGIAQVDGLPFYTEGRDGNPNVKLGQADKLRRAFEGTSSCGARRGDYRARGVRFGRARMDCGSYARPNNTSFEHGEMLKKTFFYSLFLLFTKKGGIFAR